jgi:hypothetical protein
VELDGYFFWMGIDRFYVYDGKVSELPNQMNINWVFDNLNFNQRQKVWATVVPRWGEVWWHFPFGDSEECNCAVIFNAREKTWYDTRVSRGSGASPQTIRYPVWSGNTPSSTINPSATVTLTVGTPGIVNWAGHKLNPGQSVTFSTTGVLPGGLSPVDTYEVATVLSANSFTILLPPITVPINFSAPQSGVHTCTAVSTPRYTLYGHEMGYNSVEGGIQLAVDSYIETSDLGNTDQDFYTRLIRVEPDLIQEGTMDMTVLGSETARGGNVTSTDYVLDEGTQKIDIREQHRRFRLRFSSNDIDGNFRMGKTLLHVEQGDQG